MSLKKKILKVLFLALWISISAGVMVLLVAASQIKSNKSCRGIDVDITGVEEFYFLDKEDILAMIGQEGAGYPEGRAIATFNLRELEAGLKKNHWVKDAELFFDNNLVLHVNVYEREPIARVFGPNGSSFFIDSSGFRMPLSNKMVVKLPVVTGFTPGNTELEPADSVLLEHVKKVAYYIRKNEFWMAQIAQVDILPNRNFELVPTIGNHMIQFGNGEDVEKKFKRLFVFYSQVLSRFGFDKYSRLNVQYNHQLVATRNEDISKADSLLAIKKIELMIRDARGKEEDSTASKPGKIIQALPSTHSLLPAKTITRKTTSIESSEMKKPTIPARTPAATSPLKKVTPAASEAKPKAVMRKLEQQE